jgi:hypothetical protein
LVKRWKWFQNNIYVGQIWKPQVTIISIHSESYKKETKIKKRNILDEMWLEVWLNKQTNKQTQQQKTLWGNFGGWMERVKKGECDWCALYTCMKLEHWKLLK